MMVLNALPARNVMLETELVDPDFPAEQSVQILGVEDVVLTSRIVPPKD